MNPYLFPSLPTGPRLLADQLSRIGAEAMDVPTHPDRFSPREVIAHLADWEPILRARMAQAVAEPGSEIQGIDEGERAIEMNYAASDPREQAQRYQEARAETIAWLQGLQPEDWSKHVMHNERGRMTVSDMANMLLGHDLYHLEQLEAVLRPR